MARDVTAPSFRFWFDDKYYTVQGAETMFRLGTKDDVSTMRAEYTRMRDTAQKRLKRLEKMFPESKAALSHAGGFPKLKDMDPRDFPKAFAELSKFLRAKASTVTGQKQIKEKTMQTWQEQGIDLNPENYNKAIKILEEMRKRKIVYGSDKVVELADSMLELSDKQTSQWLDHLDKLLQNSDKAAEAIQQYTRLRDAGTPVNIDDMISQLGW